MSRCLVVITISALLLVLVAGLSTAQDAKPWELQGTRPGQEITGPDGGKMVWVPAGEFDMGAEDLGQKVHHVRIASGFWLGKCAVTNAQYRQYCQDAGVEFPKGSDQGDTHPVVYVTWNDAVAYCRHYGLSLLTEAQWEYAARGAEDRKYPWGGQWDPKKCGNGQNQGPGGKTFPVGSFPGGASWCGALDMAGNAWQWCKDWFSGGYYSTSPDTDPAGPGTGEERVLRGGSWNDDAGGCRSANRGNIAATNRDINIGFRCSLTIAGPLDAQAKPSEVGGGNAYSNAKPWERQGTKAGEEIVGPDGGKMVWVPAGEFTMGSAKGEGRDDEHPAHQVRIAKGFWLGKCDVTNAQFRKFCASAKHPFPTASAEGGNHPVVSVTWAEARLYCRKQGMALPTEAQWEYAARGPEGREYPWGNEWDSKKCCNDENQDWTGHAFRVGSFPEGASWCGALDMAGNVWQWCEDWYSDKYYANSSDTDPPGPDTGLCRVLRGGSWSKDADGCRSAHRGNNDPSTRDGNYGFRCLVVP